MPLKIWNGGEKKLSESRKIIKERVQRIGWMQWFNIIEVLLAIILGRFFGWGWLTLIFLIFVRATTVAEGTAKTITRFGGVVKVFVQWTGYRLDEDGNVAYTGEKNPWYGGLRVWIGTPFDKVDKFKLRWHSVEEVQGKRVPVFHEEIKDCIMIRPDRYWIRMAKQETKDGQFPDIEYLIGMRSINPEKTRYKSPHNWVENALSQLQPLLRTYHRTKTLGELLNLQRDQIWEEVYTKNTEGQRVIDAVLRDEWGVKIDEKEIGIFDVTPPPAYQEALAAKSKAEMETEAKLRQMEIEAIARSVETVGTVIEMMAKSRGLKPQTIQRKINKDPTLQKEFLDLAKDLIVRKIGIEGGAYADIRVVGATGVERMILDALAVWKRMPMGRPLRRNALKKEEKKPQEERKEKRLQDMTPEEKEAEIEKLLEEAEKWERRKEKKSKTNGVKTNF
jgi:hypothetical protein